MKVEILSPEKKIFSGEAEAIQFPGIDGSFQVLDHHAALVSALKAGVIKMETGKETRSYTITSGFVEVLNNKASVLVEGVKE